MAMPDSQGRVHVHVDFNDMDLDGRFFVLPEDAGGLLSLHSQVLLQDAEGNSALGTVVELMDRGRAIIAMTAGSWRGRAAAASAGSEARTVQEQVSHLLASYMPKAAALTSYRLSAVRSGGAVETAAPSSGLPQPRGAVLSSL
jgi:hypothetical protein